MPPIEQNQVLYVPMLARRFDMFESEGYDNLTDELLEKILADPEDLSKSLSQNCNMHMHENSFNPTT